MKKAAAFLPVVVLALLGGCGRAGKVPLETVPAVDLGRYAGKWYEIASFPQRFQKGCQCTTAEYACQPGRPVVVRNTCRRGGIGSRLDSIEGKAFAVPGTGNAKLKVQFFWPFKGDYWIIALAGDYSYAAVGAPNRKYLWILSRTPVMEPELYGRIVSSLAAKGFDTSRLVRTVQDCPGR